MEQGVLTPPAVDAPSRPTVVVLPAEPPRPRRPLRPAEPAAYWLNLAGWGFVVLGVLVRLRQFAPGHSLWLDETLLALNLEARGFMGLTQTLEHHQVSPLGFLWANELLTNALGVNEYSLRLLSFVAGVAALPVFYLVARRVVGLWGAVVGVAFFAVSRELIGYSVEFKHYEVEVLATAAVLYLTLRLLDDPANMRRWLALAAVGLAALMMTFAAVFVLAAAGLTLLVSRVRRAGVRATWPVFACGVVWMAAFVPLTLAQLARDGGDARLQDYWAGAFMPLVPRSGAEARWFLDAWFGVFDATVGGSEVVMANRIGLLLGPLAVLGLFVLWQRKRSALVMVVLPVVLTLAASAAQAYPFADRLLLFLAPLVLLAVAAGAGAILRGLASESRGAAVVCAAAVLLFSVAEGAGRLVKSEPREDWRGLIEQVSEHALPGDLVLPVNAAGAPWLYYAPRLGVDRLEEAKPVSRGDAVDMDATAAAWRGHGRVWVIARGGAKGERMSEWSQRLEPYAVRGRTVQEKSAAAVLYEFR